MSNSQVVFTTCRLFEYATNRLRTNPPQCKHVQGGFETGMIVERLAHISKGSVRIAQGIFSPGHPIPTLFEGAGGHNFIQIYFRQVDNILIPAGIIIGVIRSCLIPHYAIRKRLVGTLINLNKLVVIVVIGLVICSCGGTIIRVLKVYITGHNVEHGKKQIIPRKGIALDLLVCNIQGMLGSPILIRPRAQHLVEQRFMIGRIDNDEDVVERAPT